jgi:phage terminase large subunit
MPVTDLYYKLKAAQTRFVVNLGGSGSSKSYSTHQLELNLQLDDNCDFDTLFIRKHASDIYDSCYKLLSDIADRHNVKDKFTWVYSNSKREIKNKKTGHRIIFKGIDDPEKIKSIAGVKRIIIEEASQLDFLDFTELSRRARGIEGIQIILLLNPININHWIKTKLLDGTGYAGRVTLIKSTYLDNPFMTDDDKMELEALKIIDENQYNIYCLAEWGVDDPNKLFAKDYNKNRHFGKTFAELYDENSDVFLCWDFNVDNTCLAIQNPGENKINVLRSYHQKGYDLPMLCDVIAADFPSAFFTVNGDASGANQSALTRGNETAYDIIKEKLGLAWEQFLVPAANPSHLNSRLLTNLIFKFCEVNISDECIDLNDDLLAVEIDDRGKMDTYKKKHPERTHWIDPFRYHLNAHHSDKIELLSVKK